MVPSATIFERSYARLDCIIVGALQIDMAGNVNVSKRGSKLIDYVGIGGFADFTTCARTVVFVAPLFRGSAVRLKRVASSGRRVLTVAPARGSACKFMPCVDEISFCGSEALKRGQRVLYVTDVAVFELQREGLQVQALMPGVDVARDIVAHCPGLRLIEGERAPELAPDSVLTGFRFVVPPVGSRSGDA